MTSELGCALSGYRFNFKKRGRMPGDVLPSHQWYPSGFASFLFVAFGILLLAPFGVVSVTVRATSADGWTRTTPLV